MPYKGPNPNYEPLGIRGGGRGRGNGYGRGRGGAGFRQPRPPHYYQQELWSANKSVRHWDPPAPAAPARPSIPAWETREPTEPCPLRSFLQYAPLNPGAQPFYSFSSGVANPPWNPQLQQFQQQFNPQRQPLQDAIQNQYFFQQRQQQPHPPNNGPGLLPFPQFTEQEVRTFMNRGSENIPPNPAIKLEPDIKIKTEPGLVVTAEANFSRSSCAMTPPETSDSSHTDVESANHRLRQAESKLRKRRRSRVSHKESRHAKRMALELDLESISSETAPAEVESNILTPPATPIPAQKKDGNAKSSEITTTEDDAKKCVVFTLAADPYEPLLEADVDKFVETAHESILDEVEKTGTRLRIESVKLNQGRLEVLCADLNTAEWMRKTFKCSGRPSTDMLAHFMAWPHGEEPQLDPTFIEYICKIQNGKTSSTTDVLAMLGEQNGIQTAAWRVYSKTPTDDKSNGTDFTIVLGVPQESIQRLEAQDGNYYMYYGIQKVQLIKKIDSGNDSSDTDTGLTITGDF